jgi:ketosteroid isomerase-like protein
VPDTPAKPYECKNPCQTIPYRVRSAAEQEIITTFQAIAKAIVVHDADEWAKHVADDFMLYASDQAPVSKSGRLAVMNGQKESNAAAPAEEIEAMRLSVYGDAAAMIVTSAVPGKTQPSYRAVRLWLKRNGRWLMALSAHTDVK